MHDDSMVTYHKEVWKLEDQFNGLCFTHILCGKNFISDELARLGSSRRAVPPGVFLQVLEKSSIKVAKKIVVPKT